MLITHEMDDFDHVIQVIFHNQTIPAMVHLISESQADSHHHHLYYFSLICVIITARMH